MNGTLERTCHRGMDPGAPTGWSWGRFLVLHPITLTTAISLGLAIGWLAGMVWACAGIVAITALTLVAARSRLVKGAIVRAMAAAARGRRDDARDSLMERSGSPRRGDLAELVALVRAIERGAFRHAVAGGRTDPSRSLPPDRARRPGRGLCSAATRGEDDAPV